VSTAPLGARHIRLVCPADKSPRLEEQQTSQAVCLLPVIFQGEREPDRRRHFALFAQRSMGRSRYPGSSHIILTIYFIRLPSDVGSGCTPEHFSAARGTVLLPIG
jgi:hypothetical protein